MQPIGYLKSPFTELENMPIQPKGGSEIIGEVVVDEQFEKGLDDLEGFSHIYLIYQFHKATRTELQVIPFMADSVKGVFSTRSPLRPNHLGLSIVTLLKREGNRLTIRGVDILDGTPILDIKPYIAHFDHISESRSGWMTAAEVDVEKKRSDNRFV
jgi:tRNA-Thr(GGU) m(6)t(6)A37 methyltransferase TsaA